MEPAPKRARKQANDRNSMIDEQAQLLPAIGEPAQLHEEEKKEEEPQQMVMMPSVVIELDKLLPS